MKLPVLRTIGRVFGFVIERRFFTLLRLVWFPALLSMFSSLVEPIYLYAAHGIIPQRVQHQVVGMKLNVDIDGDPVLGTIQVVDIFLQLVLGAIIAVSVHRIILHNDEQKGQYFYLRFTREELRYIIAGALYFVAVLLAVILPFVGHIYWVSSHGGTIPFDYKQLLADETLPGLFESRALYPVAGLSLLFALVILARFGLTFPIIVAEGRMSFWRSWQLTRGNFIRLVWFWVLITLLAVTFILMLLAILGIAIGGMAAGILSGSQTGGALGVLVLAVPAGAAFITYLVVGVTLFIAAMSFSYKALADEESDEVT
ncbi:MAG: hypothetical protein ABL973_08560 [Micropepsaceae bacterium]